MAATAVRWPGETFEREDDQFGLPVTLDRGPGLVRCGNHGPQAAYHQGTAAVRACYETLAAAEAEFAAQQAGEIWAENAWLRHAEAGDPDSWREEELERMAEACGLPVPPGYH